MKQTRKKRVVIIGMGLVSLFGNDVDTYYGKLLAGESGFGLIDRFDALVGRFMGLIPTGILMAKMIRDLIVCSIALWLILMAITTICLR